MKFFTSIEQFSSMAFVGDIIMVRFTGQTREQIVGAAGKGTCHLTVQA